MLKRAVISDCQRYRYALWRIWDESKPRVMFIGLNPSAADADLDDPTLRRCLGFAQRWGYGCVIMANLFAFRATKPADLRREPDRIGPDTDRWLDVLAKDAALIVAAWGVHGALQNRAEEVRRRFEALHCLGVTKHGYPRHPLYVPYSADPFPFR